VSDLWKRVSGRLEADLPDRPFADTGGVPAVAAAAAPADAAESPAAPPHRPADAAVPGDSLFEAATASFLAHQRKCEASYKERVADKVIALKLQLEQDIGEELPLSLPQEGGTTATVLLVHPGGLLTAWVGDSRAVLAVETAEGALMAVPLTSDHNTADEGERQRLLSCGGATGKDEMSSHVFVPEAEGGLKVTRSLGDSPFHKGDAVSAAPSVRHVRLTSRTRFAVIASDGIWDHLNGQQVTDLVAAALSAYGDEQPGTRSRSESASSTASTKSNGKPTTDGDAALAACKAVLDHIEKIQASGEAASSHVDDRSIAVMSFASVP